MYALAMNATNIATAMESIAGFNADETAAFVANYVTALWSGWQNDVTSFPTGSAGFPAYFLPAGPSMVDQNGICVRTGMAIGAAPTGTGLDFASTMDVSTAGGTLFPNRTMLGYAAQPFILEIAAESIADSTPRTTLTDMAIVLYNPYSVNLSMRGYRLTDTIAPHVLDIDLTKDDNNVNLYVPAGGYLIITTDGSFASPNGVTPLIQGAAPAKTVIATYNTSLNGSTGLSPNGAQIRLRRTYVNRFNLAQYATVDRSTYSPAFFATMDTGGQPFIAVGARTNPVNALSQSPTPAFSTTAPLPPPSFSVAPCPSPPILLSPLPVLPSVPHRSPISRSSTASCE